MPKLTITFEGFSVDPEIAYSTAGEEPVSAPSFPIPNNTILGNISGVLADAYALTGSQVTTILNTFGTGVKGLVPASPGGPSDFLRADGAWVSPGGSGAPGGVDSNVQFNDSTHFGGSGKFTFNKTSGVVTVNDGGSGGGIGVFTTNPTISGDPNDSTGLKINVTYDDGMLSVSNPGFTNIVGMELTQFSRTGSNAYGGGTNSKKTLAPLLVYHQSQAAGQKFVTIRTADFYGMGDSFLESVRMFYSGGPISGDEGQGFTPQYSCLQPQPPYAPFVAPILSVPATTTMNTTITSAVFASKTNQTVPVASTIGANPGDWIVIGQTPDTGTPNIEAVEIISVGTGTITARFILNHPKGTTITPALLLVSQVTAGEQRVLVNLTATPYNAGTVSGTGGANFTGTGTTWSVDMVGGNANNIGAISLTSDNVTRTPYSALTPLKSWYQIISVSGVDTLSIHSFSVAGDIGYRGQGVISGATSYTIRPAARVLKVQGNLLVCETSTSTWAPGDNVECAICPYPDISGFNYTLGAYTNGATCRSLFGIGNGGFRQFQNGIAISGWKDATDQGRDLVGLLSGISVVGAIDGIAIDQCRDSAISLGPDANGGRITWAAVGTYIKYNATNQGLEIQETVAGLPSTFTSSGLTTDGLKHFDFPGLINTTRIANSPSVIALANGLNSDIEGAASFTMVNTTGPFSIGGFTHPINGAELKVFNYTTQQMTIVNEDLSSTAVNRIMTLTGADVVLRAGRSIATFVYDGQANARWILTSTN